MTRTDLVGDLNCDGVVNFDDITAFSLALSDPATYATTYPGCPMILGDVNGDTLVNFDDITDFAALLSGTQMPAQKYVYDAENRLTAVTTTDDTPLLELRYDAIGRRVLTIDHVGLGDPCGTSGGSAILPIWTRHVYSGIQVVAEYQACGLSSGGQTPATGWTLAREFIWGDRFPEPIALIDWTDAGDVAAGTAETLHYVHDPLGNVVGLSDAGNMAATPPVPGKLVERYAYDAYGKTYVERWDATGGGGSGAWLRSASGASHYGNPFAWTGQRYDAGVKLYHFLFRSYSPEIGRWLQRDPAHYQESTSLYQYVRSYLPNIDDPYGDQQRSTDIGTGQYIDEALQPSRDAVRHVQNALKELKAARERLAQAQRELDNARKANNVDPKWTRSLQENVATKKDTVAKKLQELNDKSNAGARENKPSVKGH